MDYFDCAYFDQAYFDTDCGPAATGGKAARGGRLRRNPFVIQSEPDPLLVEDEELLALV